MFISRSARRVREAETQASTDSSGRVRVVCQLHPIFELIIISAASEAETSMARHRSANRFNFVRNSAAGHKRK